MKALAPYDSGNTLHLYFSEIAQTDLLTLEEELELAKKNLAGDEKAREHLVKANLRLVVKIAKDYVNYGVPLADLIAEGNVGLIKAAERYDPSKGGKLSTYAAWWIRQAVMRALAHQSKVINVPVHVREKISKIRKTRAAMQQKLGYEPSLSELSKELGISRRKLVLLQQVTLKEASLNEPFEGNESGNLGDFLGDESMKTPLENLIHKNRFSELKGLLSVLNKRELLVIIARYGLGDQNPLTLEEVGAQFNLTRERIRQIQKAALDKMKEALEQKDAVLVN